MTAGASLPRTPREPDAARLRRLVEAAVHRAPAACLLLSGGLDTSILAPIAATRGTSDAVTVVVGSEAPDREPAEQVARELGWNHHVVAVSFEELVAGLEPLVRVLATFDPMEIRNSLVIQRALVECRARGLRTAMVGDGADELFGGYEYMIRMPSDEFEPYSRRLAQTMRFSAPVLGDSLGVGVSSPYLDPDLVSFAVELPRAAKIGVHDGRTMGKLLLREAFPEAVSQWRRKDPIEVGSGSARLPAWYAERTSATDFAEEVARVLATDRIQIRDPEHLAYYHAFRRIFESRLTGERYVPPCCVHCGFRLEHSQATFCRTCGAFPAQG